MIVERPRAKLAFDDLMVNASRPSGERAVVERLTIERLTSAVTATLFVAPLRHSEVCCRGA